MDFKHPEIPKHSKAVHLLQNMPDPNSSARISASEALSHEILRAAEPPKKNEPISDCGFLN